MRFTALKGARLERELLQIHVAQRAGIDRGRLSLLENGHIEPKPGELERIAHALGVDVEALRSVAVEQPRDKPASELA